MNWRPDNRRYQYWWQHVDVRRPDRREHHRRFVNVRRLVDGRRWQHNDRRRRRLRRWWRRRWRAQRMQSACRGLLTRPGAATSTSPERAAVGGGARSAAVRLVHAIGSANAVNHAGFEIRDEQLLMGRVERHIAERGAGVLPVVESNVREHPRPIIVGGVEAVDRPRTAARSPHPGHPLQGAGPQMQAESRGGAHINVWRRGVVEDHPKHLPNLGGRHRISLRLVDPMVAARRLPRRPDVDDAPHDAIEVDGKPALTARIGAGPRPRETGDIGLSGLQSRLLGRRRSDREPDREKQHEPAKQHRRGSPRGPAGIPGGGRVDGGSCWLSLQKFGGEHGKESP